MADIFLLPPYNEDIALVLYKAIAAGILAMSTDIGGQKKSIKDDMGVLLLLLPDAHSSGLLVVRQFNAILKFEK